MTDFNSWKSDFVARAEGEGLPADLLAETFKGMLPDPEVILKDQRQREFGLPIWFYLDKAVSPVRQAAAQAGLERQARLFDSIDAGWGVDRAILAAIWAIETQCGEIMGEFDTIRSLATLAHEGRRGAMFEGELLAALRILASGVVPELRGSWAGAMGHMQFLPTTYLAHGVDADGDGRADIWGDDPSDALASCATYLAGIGWQADKVWGGEVTLPEGLDLRQTGWAGTRPVADWRALGVEGDLPEAEEVAVILPAGAKGPAFWIGENARVLSRYNPAESYVLAVGLMADALCGRPALVKDWPRAGRGLAQNERFEVQRLLAEAGHDPGVIDGRIGQNSKRAIQNWQTAVGLPADGYADVALLRALEEAAGVKG
jgi:membrane-bound lytic murein transglycosylase B